MHKKRPTYFCRYSPTKLGRYELMIVDYHPPRIFTLVLQIGSGVFYAERLAVGVAFAR